MAAQHSTDSWLLQIIRKFITRT